MTWVDSKLFHWCAIKSIGDQTSHTWCGKAVDMHQRYVSDNPPDSDRCAACKRVVEAERVAEGLKEVVAASEPAADARFDFTMPDGDE